MKKALTVLILVALIATSTTISFADNGMSVFSDVSTTHWAGSSIIRSFNEDVIAGTYYNEQTGERRFSPESTLTYAQFATTPG